MKIIRYTPFLVDAHRMNFIFFKGIVRLTATGGLKAAGGNRRHEH